MSIANREQPVASSTLRCPACSAEVATSAASCRSCHLPIADVRRHQARPRSTTARRVRTRLWGVPIYGGIVVWCLLALPTAAVFVVPAAIVGAVLHVLLGRWISAALAFVVIVGAAPLLFTPAMLADMLDSAGQMFGG